MFLLFKRLSLGDSLAVQWLGLNTLTALAAQVQSLVRKLRSHKAHGVVKKKEKAFCFSKREKKKIYKKW